MCDNAKSSVMTRLVTVFTLSSREAVLLRGQLNFAVVVAVSLLP